MTTKIKTKKWLFAAAILLIAGFVSLIFEVALGVFYSWITVYSAILVVLGLVCLVLNFTWR